VPVVLLGNPPVSQRLNGTAKRRDGYGTPLGYAGMVCPLPHPALLLDLRGALISLRDRERKLIELVDAPVIECAGQTANEDESYF